MKRSVISGAILAVFGMASAHAQTYLFTDLGHAGGVASAAAGINNAGQVVGLFADSSAMNHAVTWIGGEAIDLGVASKNWDSQGFSNPWSMSGSVISINDAGQMAWTITDTNNTSHAVAWNNGVTTGLGTLGGVQSDARGINQSGQIVGGAQNASGDWRAVVWSNGQPTELGALAGASYSKANAVNNVGQAAGAAIGQLYTPPLPVVWDQGTATNLSNSWPGKPVQTLGINDAGQVVGSVKTPNDADYYRAVEWDHGVATLLDVPAGYWSEAKGINNAGQIVGFMLPKHGYENLDFHAATWIDGQVVDLNALLPADVVDAGWVLMGANGINDLGQIVGQAFNTKTNVIDAFVLTPVPEASTFAMMLLGLGAVAMGARWRPVGGDRARG